MKRSILFSLVFVFAVSACFFSSAVLAGEGNDSRGPGSNGIDPWDVDVVVNDTTDGTTFSSSRVNDSRFQDSFIFSTFSLSSSFVLWIFEDELISIQKRQTEVIHQTSNNFRGSRYRTNKLTD